MPLLDFLRDDDDAFELDEAQRQILIDMLNDQDAVFERPVVQQRHNSNFVYTLMHAFLLAAFPIIFAHVGSQLLNAATYSNNILEDVARFQDSVISEWQRNEQPTLIYKFGQVIFREFARYLDVTQWEWTLRLVTVSVYLSYSVAMAGYILFASLFCFICLVLTTTRRCGELWKLLVNVFKSDNGVF
jgi:hypothetical protein